MVDQSSQVVIDEMICGNADIDSNRPLKEKIEDIGAKVFGEATISAHHSSFALKQLEEMDRIFMLTQHKA